MNPQLKSQIELMIELFDELIAQQAQQVVAAHQSDYVETLAKSTGMEIDAADVAAAYVGMWEDTEELKPPHIKAKLFLTLNGQTNEIPYQQPIGALHAPDKPEHLFELCMLRAEAHHWLVGKMDDGIFERMRGLHQDLIAKGQA